jgi:hypothetical protein
MPHFACVLPTCASAAGPIESELPSADRLVQLGGDRPGGVVGQTFVHVRVRRIRWHNHGRVLGQHNVQQNERQQKQQNGGHFVKWFEFFAGGRLFSRLLSYF